MQIYAYIDIRILISLRIILHQYQLYHGITCHEKEKHITIDIFGL